MPVARWKRSFSIIKFNHEVVEIFLMLLSNLLYYLLSFYELKHVYRKPFWEMMLFALFCFFFGHHTISCDCNWLLSLVSTIVPKLNGILALLGRETFPSIYVLTADKVSTKNWILNPYGSFGGTCIHVEIRYNLDPLWRHVSSLSWSACIIK